MVRNVGVFFLVMWTGCSDSYVKDINEEELIVFDEDGDGFHAGEDCDDSNSAINPDAVEVCDDIDNDCDELIDDEDDSLDLETAMIFYLDSDQDGFGMEEVVACVQPDGTSNENGDCDDDNASIHPAAPEICDEVDNDCDELIDDDDDSLDTTTGNVFYLDSDSDGYGDLATPVQSCILQVGNVDNSDDCDDSDAAIHPDATEVCDGFDNNCDGLMDDADPTIDVGSQSTFTWIMIQMDLVMISIQPLPVRHPHCTFLSVEIVMMPMLISIQMPLKCVMGSTTTATRYRMIPIPYPASAAACTPITHHRFKVPLLFQHQ